MRKLAVSAFAFAAGVFIYEYFGIAASVAAAAAVSLIAVALSFLDNRKLRLAAFIAAFSVMFGMLYSFTYARIFIKPLEKYDKTESVQTFTVCDYFTPTQYGGYTEAAADKIGTRVRLYLNGVVPEGIIPGTRIKMNASLAMTDTVRGKKSSTFPAKGIMLFAYQRGEADIDIPDKVPLRFFYKEIAQKLKNLCGDVFSESVSPFMTALLTGDTDGLYSGDGDTARDLKLAGIYHVVAVSGMHIGFLASMCIFLAGNRRRAAMFSIPLLFAFSAVTGFRPSTVRAVIMESVVMGGAVLRRESDSLTSLSFALSILLFANPVAIRDVGLQLSFLATLGIITVSQRMQRSFSKHMYEKPADGFTARVLKYVFALFSLTVGASVFTLPLTAYYFGYISLISPITNVLAIPAVSLAFISGAITCAVSLIFAPAGKVLAIVPTIAAKYILAVSKALGGLDIAVLYTSNKAVLIWFVLTYSAALYMIIRRKSARSYIIPSCVSVSALCAIMIFSPYVCVSDGITLYAVNVGQGASNVLMYKDSTIIVDCGSSSESDAGDVTADFLLGKRRNDIAAVILTHYHKDHSSGVEAVLRRLNVGSLIVPVPADEDIERYNQLKECADKYGVRLMTVENNIDTSIDESRLRIYAPLSPHSDNEKCLTVLYSIGDYDILIDGDLLGSIESRTYKIAKIPDIELLVVSHHGSSSSTNEQFLDMAKPERAVISVGYNSYGHPSEAVLKRLYDRNIEVYRTDTDGTVRIDTEY